VTTGTDDARRLAERAEDSGVVEKGARLGLIARAVVWALIGLLAASVALGGSSSQETDQVGALRAIADQPGGTVLLLALTVGFLALGLYRLLTAAVGFRGEDGAKRTGHRLKALGETVLYLAAAVSCVRMVFSGGGGGGEKETTSLTATVMGWPAGRLVVGLVGLAMVVVAVVLVVRAWRSEHHMKRLSGVPPRLHTVVSRLGVAGYAGRSLVVALVGIFLANAARTFDPQDAKGLDAALETVAQQRFGTALLLLAAAGMVCYGLWSLVEARWRDV
jgi:hypothetical protein